MMIPLSQSSGHFDTNGKPYITHATIRNFDYMTIHPIHDSLEATLVIVYFISKFKKLYNEVNVDIIQNIH